MSYFFFFFSFWGSAWDIVILEGRYGGSWMRFANQACLCRSDWTRVRRRCRAEWERRVMVCRLLSRLESSRLVTDFSLAIHLRQGCIISGNTADIFIFPNSKKQRKTSGWTPEIETVLTLNTLGAREGPRDSFPPHPFYPEMSQRSASPNFTLQSNLNHKQARFFQAPS